MIKIRLQGTSSEVKKAVETIKKCFSILKISGEYPNRNSEYVRVYLEVEIDQMLVSPKDQSQR